MKIDASLLSAMVKAGVTAEQIAMVASAYEEATAEKRALVREQGRIRQQNHRASNAMSRVTERDECDKVSPKKEIPPTPPKEKITPSNFPSVGAREFDQFWSLFPNKVGRRDAEKSFAAALQRASFADIMAGLQRYAAKTDDRPWCNPTTFLNQDRWKDQPAPPPRQPSTAPPRKLTQGESLRNMAREKGIIDDTGNPVRRLEASDRDGENPGVGDVIRLAVSGNHGW